MRRKIVGLREVEHTNPGKVDASIRVKCLTGQTRSMTGRAKVKARKEEKEKERKEKDVKEKEKVKVRKEEAKDANSPKMNHGTKVITSVTMASTTRTNMEMTSTRGLKARIKTVPQ